MSAPALVAALVVALVAGSFAMLATARAAVGDVSHTSGWCLAAGSGADAGHYISNTQTAPTVPQTDFAQNTADDANQITVELEDDGTTDGTSRDTDAVTDHVLLRCNAAQVNKAVTITPNNKPVPGITYHDPELVVSLASAATVPSTVGLRAYVKYQRAGAIYTFNANDALAANIAPASGVVLPAVPLVLDTADGAATIDAATAESLALLGDVTVLASASGDYTITLGVVSDETPPKPHYGQVTFNVSEPTTTPASDKVASASLELGDSGYDNPLTSKDEGIAEDGTEAASGGDVWLKLSVLNAAGKASANTDIKSVTIVAPGGTIDLVNALVTGRPNLGTNTDVDEEERIGSTAGEAGKAQATAFNHSNADAADDTDAKATMFVLVTATASTPGPVSVYALINGSLRSNTVDLVFTGTTAALAIEGSGKTLKSTSGELSFTVTGMDSHGNGGTQVLNSSLILTIKNADDAVVTNPAIADQAQGTGAKAANVTFKVTTGTTAAASGEYTIEAQLAGNDKSKTTATFNVAGPAANIALSADPESADATGLVSLTTTVTDEAGVNVPDGTMVEFAAVGGGASLITSGSRSTVDGVAKATLGVTGSGTTIIYATSGDAAADLSFVSTAGGDEAPAEDTVGLSCLSSTQGFATWTCNVGASASAIFALVSGRGATAIHLHNGSAWVRYSVVDGTMVPGSSDFMVAENDILYISN